MVELLISRNSDNTYIIGNDWIYTDFKDKEEFITAVKFIIDRYTSRNYPISINDIMFQIADIGSMRKEVEEAIMELSSLSLIEK